MDPERLTLGMVVIEDDDVLSVTKKRVEETCRGAIPRANGGACREPIGVDVVLAGDEVTEGSRVELRLGGAGERIRGAGIVMTGPFMGA